MSILSSQILPKHGPNIEFVALPARIEIDENDWPNKTLYQEYIIFSWPDSLSDTICSLSRSYLFFDPYAFTQYSRCEEIYSFASNIFYLASRIAECPVFYFDSEISLYNESTIELTCRTAAHLKEDLLETIMFIANKIIAAAKDGKCLAIVGI